MAKVFFWIFNLTSINRHHYGGWGRFSFLMLNLMLLLLLLSLVHPMQRHAAYVHLYCVPFFPFLRLCWTLHSKWWCVHYAPLSLERKVMNLFKRKQIPLGEVARTAGCKFRLLWVQLYCNVLSTLLKFVVWRAGAAKLDHCNWTGQAIWGERLANKKGIVYCIL